MQVLTKPSILVITAVMSILFASNAVGQSGPAAILDQLLRSNPKVASELKRTDLESLYLTDDYVTAHNQIHHYYFKKNINGIPVDNGYLHLHTSLTTDEIVAAHTNHLDVSSKTEPSPALTASQAVELAFADISLDAAITEGSLSKDESTNQKQTFSPTTTGVETIKAQLYYIVNAENALALHWLVDVDTRAPEYHLWRIYVDATTGLVTKKHDLVLSCDFGYGAEHSHSCVDHNHGTHGSRSTTTAVMGDAYRIYDIPVESPNHGTRILATDPADSLASPYGWHDDNGVTGAEYTITRGNNVLAQDDINGNNGSGYSPDGGPNQQFDFTLDFTQSAGANTAQAQNLNSSLTNLFFWNNKIHDLFYHYGFDEVSGNFQENNYGRGGNGGDYVLADGLDGSGSNNANFGTPADGGNPRMQMFLWGSVSGGTTTMSVNSPSSTAGSYTAVGGSFGQLNYSVTGDLVIVDDGGANSSQGCNTLTNGAALSGMIALIDRGNCQFGTKSLNAQAAGAVAVIICNNDNTAPFAMSGGNDGGAVNIPAVMMSQADCATIRVNIPGTNVTITTSGATPRLDGSFDNGIIAHEYGHGISNRLTGGPSAASCLSNQEQMGEGWSDFFGLVMTHETGDTRNTSRGIGTYATGAPVTGGGIRPFPYTADMTANPSTYDDIKTFSVPHGVGSVWCTMLWDMYWDLVDLYGYDPDLINGTGGNNIAIQLVMDGLKLQPCSPGFADGRDAIILADQINNQGANKCLIWNAFARRGLGASASQGGTNSRADGTEAFDLPDGIQLIDSETTDIVEGQRMTITSTAVCDCTPKTNIEISSTVPQGLTINNTLIGSVNGSTVSNSVSSLGTGDSLQVSYIVQAPLCSTPAGTVLLDDDVEGVPLWTSSTLSSSGSWSTTTTLASSGTTSWYAFGPDVTSDFALTSNSSYTLTGSTLLTFAHRYETEGLWDGGVVEISTDNGVTWLDLGPQMTKNGYPSAFASNGSSNLAGRPGFTGNSNTQFGTNTWINTEVDLTIYDGEDVRIRFRYASDDNTNVGGIAGWYIDDIILQEFTTRVISTTVAENNVTVATDLITLTQEVPDRSIIYVDSSAIDGLATGTSWTDAFVDLQRALDATDCENDVVEIWVAAGTYYPSKVNDRAATFLLRENTTIYGGFEGTEVTVMERDINAYPSILSGAIGVSNNDTDNSYHVVTAAGVDQSAILDGFTIRDGYADDSPGVAGGLLIEDSSPLIANCTLANNYASSRGGAIFSNDGAPTLRDCIISNNMSGTGLAAGLFHLSGELTLEDVTVDEASGTSVESYSPATITIRGTTTISN
jgi:hypothetical protein